MQHSTIEAMHSSAFDDTVHNLQPCSRSYSQSNLSNTAAGAIGQESRTGSPWRNPPPARCRRSSANLSALPAPPWCLSSACSGTQAASRGCSSRRPTSVAPASTPAPPPALPCLNSLAAAGRVSQASQRGLLSRTAAAAALAASNAWVPPTLRSCLQLCPCLSSSRRT